MLVSAVPRKVISIERAVALVLGWTVKYADRMLLMDNQDTPHGRAAEVVYTEIKQGKWGPSVRLGDDSAVVHVDDWGKFANLAKDFRRRRVAGQVGE